MSFFSYTDGVAIAQIIGGPADGKIIYLKDPSKITKCCSKCSYKCKSKKKKCCLKCGSECHSRTHMLYNSDSDEDEYGSIFDEEKSNLNNNQIKRLEIVDGIMAPVPKNEDGQNENIFISGPSGAGKSSWGAMYIRQYLKMFPKAKFILISGISEDKVLDVLKPKRLPLDDSWIDNPADPSEFPEHSIVVFDDIDNLPNKKIQASIETTRNALLDKGRKRHIYVLSITHNPTDNKKTKSSLLESSAIVLFPKGGDSFHLGNVLKNYCGISPSEIEQIKKMNTRWVACYKRYPKYILHEKGVFFPK